MLRNPQLTQEDASGGELSQRCLQREGFLFSIEALSQFFTQSRGTENNYTIFN